jgi:1-acyl-sn-glycerol-3-phosphate acyltransferase
MSVSKPHEGGAARAQRHWQPSRFWYYVGWVLWSAVFRLLFPLRVRGAEHVPASGPVILIANHISGLDPFALAKACPRWPHFLAKEELFRIPGFSYVIRQWGAIPIDRFAADVGSARAALQVLRADEVLAIFPEGTRSVTGELQDFRPGTVNLALKRRVPVVPAAISGTNKVLRKGAMLPRLHPVQVVFGPPIYLWDVLRDETEASRAAGAALLRERVAELLRAGGER